MSCPNECLAPFVDQVPHSASVNIDFDDPQSLMPAIDLFPANALLVATPMQRRGFPFVFEPVHVRLELFIVCHVKEIQFVFGELVSSLRVWAALQYRSPPARR